MYRYMYTYAWSLIYIVPTVFLGPNKEPKRPLSHKISIYLRAPLNPGKVRVFCALVPSLVVEAWILVGYVWNLVGEVQNLVALQTVW